MTQDQRSRFELWYQATDKACRVRFGGTLDECLSMAFGDDDAGQAEADEFAGNECANGASLRATLRTLAYKATARALAADRARRDAERDMNMEARKEAMRAAGLRLVAERLGYHVDADYSGWGWLWWKDAGEGIDSDWPSDTGYDSQEEAWAGAAAWMLENDLDAALAAWADLVEKGEA
jgi:hypothetical protein